MNLETLLNTSFQRVSVRNIRQFLANSVKHTVSNFSLLPAYEARSNWCWAVVAQAVSRHYEPQDNVEQCEIARRVFPHLKCCFNDICNTPIKLSYALNATYNLRRPQNGNILFPLVETEIENNRPLVCHKTTSGGHAVAISGTSRNGNIKKLTILDPVRFQKDCDYDTFTPLWDYTYYTKRKID